MKSSKKINSAKNLRRFTLESAGQLKVGTNIKVSGGNAKHIITVLRLKTGDRVELVNQSGFVYLCEITRVGKGYALCKIEKALNAPENIESGVEIALCLSLCRPKKFELAIQKCVELGVSSIIPLSSKRSIIPVEKAKLKIGRWRRIVSESVKQCKRIQIPLVEEPTTLGGLIGRISREISDGNVVKRMILAPVEDGLPMSAVVSGEWSRVYLVVGPEGGFDREEYEYMKESGFEFVSLGSRVLRVETASIVGVALLQYETGNLQ